MTGKLGRILVVRGGAIGDFILTLPAIAALRENFPNSKLDVLGYPRMAELALSAGIVDDFHSIDAGALAPFFARGAKLNKELSDYFSSCALILSYLYDPDDIFKSNVARVSKAQFIQGEHRPNENLDLHATNVFLKPLEKMAIFDANPTPSIRLPSIDEPSVSAPFIAIHPGSGSEKKNWPEHRWNHFLGAIAQKTAFNFLLIGGEAEGGRLKRLAKVVPDKRLRLAENQTLKSVGQLMQNTSLFIGHDSGITHLAAAVGLPVFVLWGPSNARIWRPLTKQSMILEANGGLENVECAEVVEKFIEFAKKQTPLARFC